LLFHQKGGPASFGAKVAMSLDGVDQSCMNSITGSTCRAKCSNILHETKNIKLSRSNELKFTMVIRVNQLLVSSASWLHGSTICFAAFIE